MNMNNSRAGTVLFISLPSTGGLAPYANDFCNALFRLGQTVVLLTLEQFEIPSQFRHYRLESSAQHRTRNKFERIYYMVKMLYLALKLTRSECPSLVIINGYELPLAWYVILHPRSIPVFCIQHEVQSRLNDSSIGWFQRDFYRRVTGLVIHNNTDAHELLTRKYGVRNKIYQIDLGLYDSNIFGQEHDLDNAYENTILNFGTVRPDKGVDVLVHAYPGSAACAGLRLKIAGNATAKYAVHLSTLIEKNDHGEEIEWHQGYIPLDSVASYHRAAAFVVLPFVVGRQSATLRMAIFFGKPVIVTDTGEAPHLVRKYGLGLVVPPNDVVALRTAMIELSNNVKLREECAANVRALQESPDLAWDTIVKDLLGQIDINHAGSDRRE